MLCFLAESLQPTYHTTYYNVPTHIDSSFKAWMDYRTITDTSSPQYEISQRSYTDKNGMRRVGKHYVVALGTFYTENCGDVFYIEFDDNTTISAIVGDIKQDIHTDATNRYYPMDSDKGNIVEFIVDSDVLNNAAKICGDVSKIGLEGDVTGIYKKEFVGFM